MAVTTTAGTVSETDHGGIITNEEMHEKSEILDESLFPALAIVDPELMTSVPPQLTAYQGFDALFHSVEAYTMFTDERIFFITKNSGGKE